MVDPRSLNASSQPTLVDEAMKPAASEPAEVEPLQPGRQIGRYVIVGVLGKGGMGVVYAAYDPELDRKVALKQLRPGRRRDEDGRLQLLREAQAMAQLSHPNVVTVHDVGEHERSVFVAMEFVDGTTLRGWLEQSARGWRQVVALFIEAGKGLAAAHAAQLVHRDFKPENVIVGRDGRVRVLDFGLVLPLRSEPSPSSGAGRGPASDHRPGSDGSRTGSGGGGRAIMGTPAYMAPEQLMNMGADARSDQFSFCVALYEGLYGQRPFTGSSLAQLASNVLAGDIEPPPRRSDVPPWIHRAVLTGLHKDPEHRHPSMEALLQALGRDPSRLRRRGLVASAVVVGAAGIWGAAAWSEARTQAECERQGQALREQWQPQREPIGQGLVEQGAPFAAGTWQRLQPGLDGYVDRWAQASAAACVATRVQDRWSQQLKLRADECLAERRAAFGALVEVLHEPTLEVLLMAESALATLPAPAECADEPHLRRRPPASDRDREQVLAIRSEVMRAGVEAEAGRLEAGRARLEGAQRQALELARPHLVAEIEDELGDVARTQGHYDEAVERLTRAYFGFGREGDLWAQRNIAVSLVHIEAEQRGNLDVAALWLEHALMLHDQAQGPAAPVSSNILRAQAALRLERGDFDRALADITEALRLGELSFGSEHPSLDAMRSTLSRIEQQRGNYQVVLEQTHAQLQRIETLRGPDHPEVSRALVNVATALLQTGELEAGRTAALRAVAIAERSLGPEHPWTGAALRSSATIASQRGETERAIALLERVVHIHEQQGTLEGQGVGDRLVLAGMLVQHGEHRRAIDLLEQVRQDLRGRDGDRHPDLLPVLINLGAAHRGLGDDERGAQAYREAIEVGEVSLGRDHPLLAYALNNLGITECERGNFEAARPLLERALEIRRTKLGERSPMLTGTLEGLAKVELAQGKPDQAIAQLEQARAILEASGAFPERKATVEALLDRARAQPGAQGPGLDPDDAR